MSRRRPSERCGPRLAGRLVPWRLTAPPPAVLSYATLISTYIGESHTWLNPAALHTYYWDRPVWWSGPAVVVLVQHTDTLWRDDPAATRLVCDDGTPRA